MYQLPRCEWFTLRYVCTSFAVTLESECLREITIDVPNADTLDVLRTLALDTEKHPVRKWAQTLVIKRFDRQLLQEGSEALGWVHTISSCFANVQNLR